MRMPQHPFKQVDVFTTAPFLGNPVAVVFDADDISPEDMQQIARWTNLSETTFVCESDAADYRLRIFTPGQELPFAGHPTIGSAFAVCETQRIPSTHTHFVQECSAGLIPLHRDSGGAIHAQVPTPRISSGPVLPERLVQCLGQSRCLDPLMIDVGPVWLTTRLACFEDLYGLSINADKTARLSRELNVVGITVYAADAAKEIHVRSFAPAEGIEEDPVCGSGNAAVAAHINTTGFLETVGNSYVARQGAALGRDGRIQVDIDGNDVSIGGYAVTVLDGVLNR
jgi:PhzF family phenazine biosynthesis protein